MDGSRILLEAIATRRRLRATYNGGVVLLAPHILYRRHGELYVDAVTITREGKAPRETKLGSFKLTGLGGAAIVGEGFDPDPRFDRNAERYEGHTLFVV